MCKRVFNSTRKCLQKLNTLKLCARWRTSGLRHTRKCLQKLNMLRVNASTKCKKGVSRWSAKLGKHFQKLSLSAKSALGGLSKKLRPQNILGWWRLVGRPDGGKPQNNLPNEETATRTVKTKAPSQTPVETESVDESGITKTVKTRAASQSTVQQQIPEIWQSMLSQADDELVELITKRVYKQTGLSPNHTQIAAVLHNTQATTSNTLPKTPLTATMRTTEPTIPSATTRPPAADADTTTQPSLSTTQATPAPITPTQTTNPPDSTTQRLAETGQKTEKNKTTNLPDDKPVTRSPLRRGLKPEAIRIFGQTHPVKTWKDVLKETTNVLYQRHPKQYDETVLRLWGTTKSIAARLEPEKLQAPFRPSGAKAWIGIHASAANICKAISRLLETLKHHQDSLEIQIADQWHTNTETIEILASPQTSKHTQQHKNLNSR